MYRWCWRSVPDCLPTPHAQGTIVVLLGGVEGNDGGLVETALVVRVLALKVHHRVL